MFFGVNVEGTADFVSLHFGQHKLIKHNNVWTKFPLDRKDYLLA